MECDAFRRFPSIVILDIESVRLKAVDGLYLRRGGNPLEPRRGAPPILVSQPDQPMFRGIAVDVA